VYSSPEIDFATPKGGRPFERKDFPTGAVLSIKGVDIQSFGLSHDSSGAQSYSITIDGKRTTIVTDTGKIDDAMLEVAAGSQVLLLEANYSEEMLAAGPYPPFLKKRIASARGHLSNTDAIAFLNTLEGGLLEKVYFCHLSDVNNNPGILESEISDKLAWDVEWSICRKNEFVRVL
jgi:phosphoribosyl 1,2-cyclic phosphodiesterase